MSHWPKCEHIEGSTDFSFQTQFLQIVWISSNKIYSKNQYLPHLSSENCEIKSIKSESPRAFQEHPQISIHCLFSILFIFHWENGSIINSFHIEAPNGLKPSWCAPYSSRAFQWYKEHSMKHQTVSNQIDVPPTRKELSNDTKSIAWSTMV
jgi:hypothetical protein